MTKDPQQILSALMSKSDIGERSAYDLMELLAEGEMNSVMAGAILTALRIKGESAEEVRGLRTARAGPRLPPLRGGFRDVRVAWDRGSA